MARRISRIFLESACCGLAILGLSACGSSSHHEVTTAPPAGVLVCRDPIQGPQVFGGWQCPGNADIGRAPIEQPESLMCITDLTGVQNATVGIQLFFRGRMIDARNFHSSDSSTELYVVLDRSFYPALAARSGLLKAGRYRCRFFSRGKLVHDRTFVLSRAAPQRPGRLVLPRVVQRISFIPGTLFDPSPVDKIARRSRYATWVRLRNEHTADIAVWPSVAAAKQAMTEYETGGPDSRPIHPGAYPTRLVRADRIENVTIAWYAHPSGSDKAALRGALLVSVGGEQYTRLWAIPGALMDASTASASIQSAGYLARIVPGGCPNGCGLNDLEVAIWPSVSAAENYFNEYKDVHDQGPFERVKNATISWNFKPSSAERAAVMAALH
jgi:hypothetical protein